MLELLRAWLNGSKEYFTGVALYEKTGSNEALKKLFLKGATDFTRRRLQEELLTICDELKSKQNEHNDIAGIAGGTHTNTISLRANNAVHANAARQDVKCQVPDTNEVPEKFLNAELYNVTKLQADKLYKKTMNNRAVLFSLAMQGDFTDPNTEAKINGRAKLALAVVTGFQEASVMYEKAIYVKDHGRLPDQDDHETESEYDHLPEHLVKQTLDNLRKNLNKMKKREQTPERVALQQKHEANIEKLLKKWHSLKP